MNRVAASLQVNNDRGVHGRVATRLAEIALEHGVALRIDRDGEGADCASIRARSRAARLPVIDEATRKRPKVRSSPCCETWKVKRGSVKRKL